MLQHEAALTKAEETLEEDTAAFDKFLKESDEKVQQAMSRADAEMKAKQEKVSPRIYYLYLDAEAASLPSCHMSDVTCVGKVDEQAARHNM